MKTFKEISALLEKEYDKQQERMNGVNSPLKKEYIIDGWWCHAADAHPPSQQMLRNPSFSDADLKKYYTNSVKKLNTFTKKVNDEYLFYSKSLHQSMIVDVSFDGMHSITKRMNSKNMPEFRVLTFLEKDKNEARLSSKGKKTPKVVVESVDGVKREYEVIEID